MITIFNLKVDSFIKTRLLFSFISTPLCIPFLFMQNSYSKFFEIFFYNGLIVLALLLLSYYINTLFQKDKEALLNVYILLDLMDLVALDAIFRVILNQDFSSVFFIAFGTVSIGSLYNFIIFSERDFNKKNLIQGFAFIGFIIIEDAILALKFHNGNILTSFIKVFCVATISLFFVFMISKIVESYKIKLEENKQLNGQLINSMRFVVVGEMFSSILHDLNNVLTSVCFYADYLSFKDVDPEKKEKYSRNLMDNLSEVRKVTDLVLSYTRADSIKKEKVDLEKIIHSAVDFATLGNKELKSGKILINVQEDIPTAKIFCVRYRLYSVILNIIMNASQSLDKDNTKSEKFINISAIKEKNKYVLKIWDNGPGISKDDLPRIFEQFTTKKEGTGIGLYLAYLFVKNELKGELSASSILNEKTEFILTLPLEDL